jgi:hypothetical protein
MKRAEVVCCSCRRVYCYHLRAHLTLIHHKPNYQHVGFTLFILRNKQLSVHSQINANRFRLVNENVVGKLVLEFLVSGKDIVTILKIVNLSKSSYKFSKKCRREYCKHWSGRYTCINVDIHCKAVNFRLCIKKLCQSIENSLKQMPASGHLNFNYCSPTVPGPILFFIS